MNALISTLADLSSAKLTAYYAPPPAGAPTTQPSTDPSVYSNPDFLKQMNAQTLEKYAVDVPNRNAADRYDFLAKQWEQNKSTSLPAPPQYVRFDPGAFDQWWSELQANPGENAPPLFFIKPVPQPPAPQIVAAGAPPPPPATDGPIGAPVPGNPNVFNPSSADNYPDGYPYAGPTGVYQKHVYSNPFTADQTRVIWIKIA